MAGHSKWANIQHRKKAQDAKRGKLFTRLIREIVVATKTGGADPDANPSLRTAVDKAKSHSVPKDAIDRAIKRGAGDLDGSEFEEIRYEGYGPAGIAFIVDCLSDNRNRTVAEVRHAFSKSGGNLGQTGSVAYLFSSLGVLLYAPGSDENSIIEVALEAGAEDVITGEDGSLEVLTSVENYIAVKQFMLSAGFEADDSDLTMRAQVNTSLDLENAAKVLELVNNLESSDDVQGVYYNADIPEAAYL